MNMLALSELTRLGLVFLLHPPASAPQVLGLQTCTALPSLLIDTESFLVILVVVYLVYVHVAIRQ